MQGRKAKQFGVYFVCLACVCSSFIVVSKLYAQSGVIEIDALVAGCGDLQVSGGEECDGTNLASQSCATKGFTSGTLSCTSSCLFNTSQCVLSGGGGGGGGGSGGGSNSATVVLTGRAYPRSVVTLLKDAQVVATTVADDSARFQIAVRNLASGAYVFSVYGEDSKKVRSPLLTFPVSVTKGILVKIESIFIAPTIAVDKSEVRKGDPLLIFGQSTPISDITLEINSEEQIFVKTPSDTSGIYLHSLDTSVLTVGDHHAQGRTTQQGTISSQSASVGFEVGTQNVFAVAPGNCSPKGDFNKDCRVNLVDFSIIAFWYGRTLTPEFSVREKAHVNGDGKVNLVDFSIMAFYWTG